MRERQLLELIAKQVATMTRLLALSIGEGKSMREQIATLARAGLEPKVIADLLGTTPNAVSVTLYQLKTSKTPKGKVR